MKYSHLRDFEKYLKDSSSQQLAALYLILAKDAFERKTAVDLLIKHLLAEEMNPTLCLKIFEGEQLSSSELISELQTLPFFAKRLIVVINQADKLAKPLSKELELYFSHPNQAISLIISASTLNHATTFYKKAVENGISLEIQEEKAWEKEKTLIEWVSNETAAKGKKIEKQACEHLVKQIGPSSAILHQELEKLFCYVGERHEITLRDIAAICSSVNIETVWQLGEALFRQDTNAALRISKALLEDGVAFILLLRQLRAQFQTEFQVCATLANGGTKQDVAAQFPYMKGQILERHVQMSQAYGMERFKSALQKIDESEMNAKNSLMDADFLSEILMIKLTT